jgi:C-terminal peptidase prc
MKKLLSIFTAFAIFAMTATIPLSFAQTKIVIPAASEEELNSIQLDSIKGFLEDYRIIRLCLGNKAGEENAEMTFGMAICSIVQVLDPKNANRHTAWKSAKKLGLVGDNIAQIDAIRGIDFLTIVFKASGISISPLSEANYQKIFANLKLRLKKDELRAIATAIEQGLIPEPQTQKDAQTLKNILTKKPLKIAEGLGMLFQISTSKHSDTPVITINSFIGANNQPIALEGILKEIISTIKSQSYFSSSFDEKAAMEAAIKAAVKSLAEDHYIEYYTEEEYKSFTSGLNGNLEGIGAYIEEKAGKIIIVSPIEGSPADKAGVKAGDVILSIDDISVEGLNLQQAIEKIRGPQGSKVKLKVIRAGQTLEITITREKISIPAVVSSNKDGIEIIKIVQFSSTVSSELLAEIDTLKDKKPRGIIIDLRNDPGGFLNEVVTIVNFFLEKDKPVVYLSDRQQKMPINTTADPIIKNIPISVLINKGSASASEILAGALQSYGIAKIYGETSYGKGSVQNIITLQDPTLNEISAFKFTTSEYLIGNPKGEPISINGIGVKPNDNPGGPDVPLLDDELTPNDEAVDMIINLMNGKKTTGPHR